LSLEHSCVCLFPSVRRKGIRTGSAFGRACAARKSSRILSGAAELQQVPNFRSKDLTLQEPKSGREWHGADRAGGRFPDAVITRLEEKLCEPY
jgi:hypothetical protein